METQSADTALFVCFRDAEPNARGVPVPWEKPGRRFERPGGVRWRRSARLLDDGRGEVDVGAHGIETREHLVDGTGRRFAAARKRYSGRVELFYGNCPRSSSEVIT